MTTRSLSVPKTWDDIAPEWMSEALAADHRGATVEAVRVESRDDGCSRSIASRSGCPRTRWQAATRSGCVYRASVAHGLTTWLVTAGAGEWQRPEVSIALAQRYSQAYSDLDTAAALAEIVG